MILLLLHVLSQRQTPMSVHHQSVSENITIFTQLAYNIKKKQTSVAPPSATSGTNDGFEVPTRY